MFPSLIGPWLLVLKIIQALHAAHSIALGVFAKLEVYHNRNLSLDLETITIHENDLVS